MRKISRITFIFCGLLMLAAFPVLGQNEKKPDIFEIRSIKENKFADYVIEKIESDKIDLSRDFKIVLEGVLIKQKIENNREIVVFDKDKTKWLELSGEEAGNAEVGEIAKKAIETFSNSGFLGYFYDLGIENFKLNFYQDEGKIAVNFESPLETEERGKTLASAINGLVMIAKMQIKGDEKILLDGFQTPFVKDKIFFINFELPKHSVQEIINRNLTDYKNRKLSEQK